LDTKLGGALPLPMRHKVMLMPLHGSSKSTASQQQPAAFKKAEKRIFL